MTLPPPADTSVRENKDERITEDEASLYDRQIRLWGLEAQNRMRSATILVLSLRSLAHETIKNLVLAGVGRLIVMDDAVVTEEDLGTGFLFREEEGAVGKLRTDAALPQIQSLNPLVSLTALPTLSPFIPTASASSASSAPDGASDTDMVSFLQRERVDVVVACDMTRVEIERINGATRTAGAMLYAAGSYGFYGYAFADLGESFEYLVTPAANPKAAIAPVPTKRRLSYAPFSALLDRTHWDKWQTEVQGGSPFVGLSRIDARMRDPRTCIAILALWEYERVHGRLPSGEQGTEDELRRIMEDLRKELGIKVNVLPKVEDEVVQHLAEHALEFFPPTLAILGGLLAQDVLRAISRKDRPIANLLVLDSAFHLSGTVNLWGMSRE